MNRKFLIAAAIVLTIVVGLWIWTLAIPKSVINIGGSASVDPFMQRVTNKYKKQKGTNFVYSSTGSSSGINNLKSQVYEIGFISKEVPLGEFPDGEIHKIESDQFAHGVDYFKDSLKTHKNEYYWVNFARDALVFIYNIQGTNFEPFENLFALEIGSDGKVVDNNFLKLIYEHNKQDDLLRWPRLAAELLKENNLLDDPVWKNRLAKVKDIDVTPYASTPGSGTRTSFETLTKVKPGQAVNQYGNNGSIFSQINASHGAFGFVSLAFAQEIKKQNYSNLKTVIIQQGTKTWNIAQGAGEDPYTYPLTRPFIAIFYYDENSKNLQQILDFVFWFVTDPSLTADYHEEGLSQMTFTFTWTIDFFEWRKEQEVWDVKIKF